MIRSLFSGFQLLLSRSYWNHAFSLTRFIKAIFVAFGSFWAVQPVWEILPEAQQASLRPFWWVLAILAILNGIRDVWPTRRIECRLKGRDVTIAIEVGDVFQTNDAIVVGSNQTFDTLSAWISKDSVQGQYTAKYYDSISHLDTDLDTALAGQHFVHDAQKNVGKQRVFPVGTTAQVKAKNRNAYLVAISNFNHHGVATGTMEDVRVALAGCWQYITDRAGNISALRMPVIGTGFTRLVETRETVIKEIVQSFVVACSERRFCEALTVVISPADYKKYDINLGALEKYLEYLCHFTEFKQPADQGQGAPVLP